MELPVFCIDDDVPGERLGLTARPYVLPWTRLLAIPLLLAGLLLLAQVLGASSAWLWADVVLFGALWGRELATQWGRWSQLRIDRPQGHVHLARQVLPFQPAHRALAIHDLAKVLLSWTPARGRSVLLPVTLELVTRDGRRFSEELQIEGLDRPDEAFDLAFRLAHALGFPGYWVRQATGDFTQLELLRDLEGTRTARARDPYREPARAPLAGGAVATAVPSLEGEAVYAARRAPPPPFEPKRLDSAFVATSWEPRRRLVLSDLQANRRPGDVAPDRQLFEVVFDGSTRLISFATPMARRSARFGDVEGLIVEVRALEPGRVTARLSVQLPGRDERVVEVRPALDAALALHKLLPLVAELAGWLECPVLQRDAAGLTTPLDLG